MAGSGSIYILKERASIKKEIENELIEKLENIKNPDDHDTLCITVATPRNRILKNYFFISFFERYFHTFIFLKKIFDLQL